MEKVWIVEDLCINHVSSNSKVTKNSDNKTSYLIRPVNEKQMESKNLSTGITISKDNHTQVNKEQIKKPWTINTTQNRVCMSNNSL